MDRDDARFVVDALDSRLAGDREAVERLAASSLMRLSTLATRIRELAESWEPGLLAAAEIMVICRDGAAICDTEPSPLLKVFVDKMRKLTAEPPSPPKNRAERRARAAKLPSSIRRSRLVVPSARVIH